jgi:hypothetical protein
MLFHDARTANFKADFWFVPERYQERVSAFPNPSTQLPEYYLQTGHGGGVPHTSQLTLHDRRIISL